MNKNYIFYSGTVGKVLRESKQHIPYKYAPPYANIGAVAAAAMELSLKTCAVAAICAILGSAVYMNTLYCGIVYDDEPAILKNKDLRPSTPWHELFLHDFWGTKIDNPTSHKSYRPVCVATYRLNYLFHQLEPMGYHLVNVLVHSAVSFLFALFCGCVLGLWPSLVSGVIFAVHPIHTEAVRI